MDKNFSSLNAICGNDYGGEERRQMLRKIGRPVARFGSYIAPGLPARGLIGTDVSIMDRRSVKAQLAGKGDFRAAWWNLNVALHCFFNHHASLESVMYSFHRRHHAMTIGRLTVAALCREVFRVMSQDGLVAGMRKLRDCRIGG